MNTTQLECFIHLARTLNYVRTAEQLNMTQPAVSKQIKSLENELGARLFERTTRSVSLTQVGQQFLSDATTMLDTFYRSKEKISKYDFNSKYLLRIGYSDPHCINTISNIMKKITNIYPNLTPMLVYDQTDANLSKLALGQLDLVIGMKDAQFHDDSISFSVLHEDAFVCVITKDHPLLNEITPDKEGNYRITSDVLYNHRQIISIPPYLMRSYFSRGHKIVPVNDSLNNTICINANEAYGLVLSGLGYSLIPEHLIMPHSGLIFIDWVDSPHSQFGIYSRKHIHKNSNSVIMQFIKESKNEYNI